MATFSVATSSNQYISFELETRMEGQSTADNIVGNVKIPMDKLPKWFVIK